MSNFKLGIDDELKRIGTARRRAASSCNSFAIATFSSSFFYRNTAFSSRSEAGQQMYTRGSVICAATVIDPQISPTPPLIFTGGGQKVQPLVLSLTNARIFTTVVWKPSKISSPFLNVVCINDLAMFPPRLVHIGPCVFEIAAAVTKTDEKSVVNRQ